MCRNEGEIIIIKRSFFNVLVIYTTYGSFQKIKHSSETTTGHALQKLPSVRGITEIQNW